MPGEAGKKPIYMRGHLAAIIAHCFVYQIFHLFNQIDLLKFFFSNCLFSFRDFFQVVWTLSSLWQYIWYPPGDVQSE